MAADLGWRMANEIEQRPAWHRRRGVWVTAGIVIVVLAAVWVTLPFFLRTYVVKTLNKIPGYSARLDGIDVNLFRGEYTVRGINLIKTTGNVPVPFFSAPRVNLAIYWRALFHRQVVGVIDLENPKLNFVNAPTAESAQIGIPKDWLARVKELSPVTIARFDVHNGEIHFRDFHRQPQVDLSMTHVEVIGKNLSTRGGQATIEAHGQLAPRGKFYLALRADPFATKPTFQLAAQMTGVELTAWNDFLEAYGGVTAKSGEFEVSTEMNADHGELKGYIKPIFIRLKLIKVSDFKEHPLRAIWETIVAGVAELFTNQPKDQIATRIPLSGSLDNPQTDLWATIGELLRNAYIQALFPGLEGWIKGNPPK